MNKIITISRQFSSGGREVGKRLAEALNFAYYDKELVQKVATKGGFDAEHVEKQSEQYSYQLFPYQIGQSFATYEPYHQLNVDLKVIQNKLLKEIAEKENAVIIGRCADYVLKEYKPFKVFIYASNMECKINRCNEKNTSDNKKSNDELIEEINSIDQKRAKYYNYITEQKWAEMSNYDLCIDTSSVGVKGAVEIIAKAIETKYN